ncbi:MAG: DUF1043 family protein [Enterobacterales bacterium]|nr:DUF1043 family protein [Enterobacterales bacterium]
METLSLLGIIIGALVGFVVGKKYSLNEIEKNKLEQALKEKTAELETFHAKVNGHFEKTAELFNHVSDSYQSLYDHMAKSSTQLCAGQTFQTIGKPDQAALDSQKPEEVPTANPKLKQSKDEAELFDADQLYNAHDYRNQVQIGKEQAQPVVEDNKVVEITRALEDTDQALDYAIKEKGIINHNSLDIDGVKTKS